MASDPFYVIGLLVLCISLWVFHVKQQQKNFRGPPSWPLIGAVLTHATNLHRFHDYVTDYCRLYTTFCAPYPSFNYYFTALPANVEHMLKTNFQNYVKGSFMYDKHQEFLGDGIFSVDGVEWKQQRKTASYEFASKALKAFSEMAFREKAVALASLVLSEAQDGKHVDMQDLMLRLTFDSFSKVGFGLEMSTLQKKPPPDQLAFVHAFDESNVMVFLRYVDPLWKLKRWLKVGSEAKLAKSVATLNGIVFSYIEQRRREIEQGLKNKDKPDLLSRFLALSESNPEEFTDRKIRDIILNFMIAGRDTTALTLCWLLYALCNNPRVQEKLIEELFQVEGVNNMGATNDGSFPSQDQIWRYANLLTYEKITGLHYLQACLQETLRLYPPVPNDLKIAVAPDTLPDGTKVKKGDCVNVVPYAMGRMEWLWGEDAMEFKPERFIKGGVCQQESPFKLTAFMAGPRICLGKDFAFLQMKVTAAILLRFFKFEIVPGHNVRYRIMLTLHMSEEGLRMNVFPRSRKTKNGHDSSTTIIHEIPDARAK